MKKGLASVSGESEHPDEPSESPPVYGLLSVVGRAREMEDEISVKMNLCRPEINGYQPVHYFGLFDGHGGRQVSTLCKENMHVIIEEELMLVKDTAERLTGGEGEAVELWKKAISKTFERMDAMAIMLCGCSDLENFNVCRHHPRLSVVGSTAMVVLLTHDYIIVANCGDSRAILCRNGNTVQLSVDHKPDREDERARIEALGGKVLFVANAARVEGVLSISRAIGDRFLKQMVTSEPEYMFMKRDTKDRCLILGSNGLWNVVPNELCCAMVHNCPQEDVNHGLGVTGQRIGSRDMLAAAGLLVRLAMGRRSTENISVLVVDLRM
ncbi:hypothetical protein R6Q59_036895 [Mikania micrantha]